MNRQERRAYKRDGVVVLQYVCEACAETVTLVELLPPGDAPHGPLLEHLICDCGGLRVPWDSRHD